MACLTPWSPLRFCLRWWRGRWATDALQLNWWFVMPVITADSSLPSQQCFIPVPCSASAGPRPATGFETGSLDWLRPMLVQWLVRQINLPLTYLHITCFATWNRNWRWLFLNEADFTIDKGNRKTGLLVSIWFGCFGEWEIVFIKITGCCSVPCNLCTYQVLAPENSRLSAWEVPGRKVWWL